MLLAVRSIAVAICVSVHLFGGRTGLTDAKSACFCACFCFVVLGLKQLFGNACLSYEHAQDVVGFGACLHAGHGAWCSLCDQDDIHVQRFPCIENMKYIIIALHSKTLSVVFGLSLFLTLSVSVCTLAHVCRIYAQANVTADVQHKFCTIASARARPFRNIWTISGHRYAHNATAIRERRREGVLASQSVM